MVQMTESKQNPKEAVLMDFSPSNETDVIFNEEMFKKGYEGDEHLDKKLERALELMSEGWDVMIEAPINKTILNRHFESLSLEGTNFYADLVAIKDGKIKIVEVGGVCSERKKVLPEISDNFEHLTIDNPQKSFYPSDEVAEWVEDTAEESDRSESYVLNKMVTGIRESVGEESIDIHQYEFKAEE